MARLVFSIPEAAAALGISPTLYRKLAKRGEVPVLRMGDRRLVVPKIALARYINERSVDPTTPTPDPESAVSPAGAGRA